MCIHRFPLQWNRLLGTHDILYWKVQPYNYYTLTIHKFTLIILLMPQVSRVYPALLVQMEFQVLQVLQGCCQRLTASWLHDTVRIQIYLHAHLAPLLFTRAILCYTYRATRGHMAKTWVRALKNCHRSYSTHKDIQSLIIFCFIVFPMLTCSFISFFSINVQCFIFSQI